MISRYSFQREKPCGPTLHRDSYHQSKFATCWAYAKCLINIAWEKHVLMQEDTRTDLVDMLYFCDAMCAGFSESRQGNI